MAERSRSAMIQKLKFLKVYSVARNDLLQDPAFEYDQDSRQWVGRVLDHFVPRGNLKNGLSVIESFRYLKQGKELTNEEEFLASILGWSTEMLQAYVLALDDIIGCGHIIRDHQSDRFELSTEGAVVADDGIFLHNYNARIVTKHFRSKPCYIDIVELFNEVEFLSISGKMMYLITATEGEKDLSKYSMQLYRRIAEYKTAYYSFYLPVACALILSGENLGNHMDVKHILVNMGIYFQVQDDYLDCYGDPKKTGKIGTDIQDFKLSWLVVKALERCNGEQKKLLSDHYGKDDPEDVAKVKSLYNDLDLQGAFVEYEAKTYKELLASIESHPRKGIQALLTSFLGNIHARAVFQVFRTRDGATLWPGVAQGPSGVSKFGV